MAIQTNYPGSIPKGYAGMVSDQTPSTLISRTVEDAAGIGFGVAVTQGTADEEATAFAGSGDVLGLTVRDRSVDPGDPDKFAQYDTARILTQGAIWVTASVAVNAGEDVYVTAAGEITNVASGNTQIVGARFDTSTSGTDELAIVRIK